MTFRLRHPRTHEWTTATVVTTGAQEGARLRGAMLRFRDYRDLHHFAEERLLLVGKPLGEQRATLRQLKREVEDALLLHLGLDARAVRSRTVRGLDDPRTPEPEAGVTHDGRVYLERETGAFDRTTRTHEVLHALSQDFLHEVWATAGTVGEVPTALAEGITEYFSYAVTTPAFGHTPDPTHPYHGSFSVAEAIAEQIGATNLREIVFGRAGARLATLQGLVDRGRPGTFAAVNALLGRGDFEGALRILGAKP